MIRSLLAATALALSIAAPAAGPVGPSRAFTGADIFGIEAAADPQISPDGSKIAYVRRANDVMTDRTRSAIWLIDVKTGEQVPIAAGPGANMSPRWSPDGKRLAYISTAEGGGAQLYVRWMATGQAAKITAMPDTPGSVAWSPDGRTIAYTLNVPDEGKTFGKAPPKPEGATWAAPLEVITSVVYRRDGGGYSKPGFDHLFVVPADGGSPRQLSFGAQDDNGPLGWTPDGREILFTSNRGPDREREALDSEIFAVDVATATTRQITDRRGPDGGATVSPDGRWIAYLGFDDKRLGYQSTILYVMSRDGSGGRALTASLDRSVGSATWSADSKSIYVDYDDHAATKVARVGLDGSIRTVAEGLSPSAIDRPYTGGDWSVAKDGTVAITAGTPLRPADVAVVRGGAAKRLTSLNSELLAGKTLGAVKPLAVKAADGRAVDAWIVTPPAFDPARKYPLILEIHGGPFSAYGPVFSTDNQLYAAAGYVVLYVNPRGSTSYGAEFANLIHHAYPGDDYGDLMAAVDAAIAGGSVDPDNLFVTGGSGGGVLTTWIVGKTDRFKGAVAQKPVIDWASFVLTADSTPYFARYWFGKFPWEDPQGYWARSPLSLVGNVKTPTMVVVGSEDYRTPVSESEQYYTALQLRGVPTALVKVPGASHGGLAARPSQSAAKASAILAWFEKYRVAK
ncbi:S9 family peptidase [Sphingomonas naphthae]|uniref:S9 family peptidase n=1 Tax=Sphingomonas naphthae TaxID=1813468 RepID=A0ABY7TJ95_9SPHN|nr:S9 family peptidase [Sphingomonas naphthae]WCT72792.1 S9 family peptidase [Sphingomonas naphthae]